MDTDKHNHDTGSKSQLRGELLAQLAGEPLTVTKNSIWASGHNMYDPNCCATNADERLEGRMLEQDDPTPVGPTFTPEELSGDNVGISLPIRSKPQPPLTMSSPGDEEMFGAKSQIRELLPWPSYLQRWRCTVCQAEMPIYPECVDSPKQFCVACQTFHLKKTRVLTFSKPASAERKVTSALVSTNSVKNLEKLKEKHSSGLGASVPSDLQSISTQSTGHLAEEEGRRSSPTSNSYLGIRPARKSEIFVTPGDQASSDEEESDTTTQIPAVEEDNKMESNMHDSFDLAQRPTPSRTKKQRPLQMMKNKTKTRVPLKCKFCSAEFAVISDLNGHIFTHFEEVYRLTDQRENYHQRPVKIMCRRCNSTFFSLYIFFVRHNDACDADITIGDKWELTSESVEIPVYEVKNNRLQIKRFERRQTEANGQHVDVIKMQLREHTDIDGTDHFNSLPDQVYGTSMPLTESYMDKVAFRSLSSSRHKSDHPGTSIGSPTSYKTAQSTFSSYATAPRSIPFLGGFTPGTSGPRRGSPMTSVKSRLRATKILPPSTKVFSSEWINYLQHRNIILPPDEELDWSGMGQHIEYAPHDESSIPLSFEKVIGHSATALVESVKCRRIRLARKRIKCHRRLSKKDLIGEVEHLQRLQHSHIVRLVGTYTIGQELAILLYPVTEWNLEEFMDSTVRTRPNNHSIG